MKNAFLIATLIFLIGCGGSLKNSWTNFRAYYNTYYNAKENYQIGLRQVQEQPVELDVTEPIRVHQRPVNTGGQEFQQAIDKGAQLLRKFPDSKWVDETLELIGKSYYYRQEFYSALQKFEEQYNVATSPEMRQRSVVWKGRVMMDLDQYSQGIVFLEEQRSALSDSWHPDLLGKAEVLLAEHSVKLGEWSQAEDYLTSGVGKLEKGTLKARAYFLYGQVLEIQERFEEASFAYGRAKQNQPDFELLYWSNFKQAEVLRKMGNLDRALAIYEQMRKDDKNVERLPEIYYEIARTHEAKGDIEQAQQIYKNVLRSQTYTTPQKTRADIYYRLGQINTTHYNRFRLAAAYYDSSSTLRSSSSSSGVLEEDMNTQTLAKAYGQYSKLQSNIAHLDSLLWLGSLTQSEFDSVINVIKQQKLEQLEQQQSRGNSNVLTNVPTQESSSDDHTSGVYGFLNHQNSRLIMEARTSFRAVWGNRALVDNWRRIEAVRSSRQGSSAAANIGQQDGNSDSQQGNDPALAQIDLSEIPFTEMEKEQTRNQIGSNKYELGNLFLLTLQNQDSAAHYFRKVAEDHPAHPLVPRALYSLYELNSSQGNSAEAQQWATRLREEYPNSRYTNQLLQRLGEEQNASSPATPDSAVSDLASRASNILSSAASTEQIANELRNLALAHSNTLAAPMVHFEAIKQYIKLAREQEIIEMKSITDSLATDSTVTDSAAVEMEFMGAYWDSVRMVLNEHQEQFSGNPSREKVDKLSEELGPIAENQPQKQKSNSVATCRERGIKPEISQGMDTFLKTVNYPEQLKGTNLAGSVEYEMRISSSGQVQDYELVSQKTNLGIEEALEEAIQDHLTFAPLDLDESTPALRCRISFPISR